jgi:hypothetical protein
MENKLKRTLRNNVLRKKGGEKMLSRDCDGCGLLGQCKTRFKRAQRGDKVTCPDGTEHLIDEGSEQ